MRLLEKKLSQLAFFGQATHLRATIRWVRETDEPLFAKTIPLRIAVAEVKMARLTAQLEAQFAEGEKLQKQILTKLPRISNADDVK